MSNETEPTGVAERIAVLLPCHNEAATIGKVIDDFRAELPQAVVYVFDNNCADETAAIARNRGAKVVPEPRQGKGFVVEAMLDGIEADLYVMADGDDTYPASCVHELIAPVRGGRADMVVGARRTDDEGRPARSDREDHPPTFRPLHVAGNRLVRWLINRIFGANLTDILSGYRVFNRKVVNRVPVVSAGFEVETELTIHMLYYHLRILEVPVPYGCRPAGSESKLRTFRDGFRVLWKLFCLFRNFKPMTFFGGAGLVLFALALAAGAAPVADYIRYRYVHHVPLAILATGLMLLSVGSVFLGILLHAVNWRFKELHNVMVRGKK